MAVHGKPTLSFFTSPSWEVDALTKECIPIKTGAQEKNIVFTMSILPPYLLHLEPGHWL